MRPSSTGNFFKFTLGFLLFISLSFGLTYAVNTYSTQQQQAQAAAAVRAAFMER